MTKEPPTIARLESLYTFHPRTPTYLPYPVICAWALIRMLMRFHSRPALVPWWVRWCGMQLPCP